MSNPFETDSDLFFNRILRAAIRKKFLTSHVRTRTRQFKGCSSHCIGIRYTRHQEARFRHGKREYIFYINDGYYGNGRNNSWVILRDAHNPANMVSGDAGFLIKEM